MTAKLTNDIVDQRLSGRSIKRSSDIINGGVKSNFECLICNYIWKAIPDNIIRGKGCPQCAGNIKLTNQDIDTKLQGRHIKRLDDYKGLDIKINFQCLVEGCSYIWETEPKVILNLKCGCPQCAGIVRLTNEIIDQRLCDRNIKRLDDYINNKRIIHFQCLVKECQYIWKTRPDNIINNETGCPKCVNRVKLTNEDIDKRLNERNIKRIDDFVSIHVKINFQCLLKDCNYIWKATPNHVLNGQTGCPNCLLKNEKIIFDLLNNSNIKFERHKSIKNIINIETKRIIVDFYFDSINTIIEYNGRQHYEIVRFGGSTLEGARLNFEKQQKRDRYLQQLCDKYNIKLIWIDGREYFNSKLKEYMIKEIIPLLLGAH
jgi:hypothetical protein